MINYVVALYFGKRRNLLVQRCIDQDPYYLLKHHIMCFHKYKMDDVHKVTFVVNPSENREIDENAVNVLNEYASLCSNKNVTFEMLHNEDNKHISYGAWNFGVINGLLDRTTKHFFLLEDDYAPCADNFYSLYLERASANIAYVCQMWQPSKTRVNNPDLRVSGRVAITNGLLNADASRKVYEKNKTCLELEVTNEYEQLMKNKTMDPLTKKYILSGVAQQKFVKLYEYEGYDITDLGSDHCQLFLTSKGVIAYRQGSPATIEPIHKYEPINKESFI